MIPNTLTMANQSLHGNGPRVGFIYPTKDQYCGSNLALEKALYKVVNNTLPNGGGMMLVLRQPLFLTQILD